MSNGLAIELDGKFAWMEDSVLVYTTHGCKVIQQGENIEGNDDYFIVLEFYKTKCVRSVATDCSPSIGIYPETKSASFIAELHNSNWDDEAHKKYTYGGTPKYTDRKHYVVSNHDVFHEILAESFSEKKISHTNADYEITKNIYLYAKAQIV